ncbi:uncharacterized protein N7483_004435 [Penicillium malachiteum]|uniref:uncharacterized protein n=1 Tax=Penicillium malachiteum TaxID=1324776 RepID=UPI002547C9DF|nr:uncharacterized protein N7483_004435 [Penicillium malachiteum]KAJ5729927.1 hypothetical protein N7483_004435 [Penicillium malachiteum]
MSTSAATQGPVEARSLSSITAIASNPPRLPTQSYTREARPVDIFLSPVKPPTKSSVSAEAINASLYYLHVSTPDDDALLQEVEQQREEEAQRRRKALEDDPSQQEFARMNHVRRKPVGGAEAGQEHAGQEHHAPALDLETTAPLLNPPSLPNRPVAMPRVSAENMSFSGTPVANASPLPSPTYPHVDAVTGSASQSPVTQSPISRRPLPPLPPHEAPFGQGAAGDACEPQPTRPNRWSAFAGEDQPVQGQEPWRSGHDAVPTGRYSLDASKPPLPPRPTQIPDRSSRSPGQSPSRQRKTHQHPPSSNAGFNITLIRRDPTSGTQWNVATISTPRRDHNIIDLDIATPGYNRFARSDEPLTLASLAANLPAGMMRTAAPPSLPVEQPREQQQATGPRKFHRQLCVSKPFDDSGVSSSEFANGLDSSSKLKSGYYVFNSPWNGTCTFSSSVNGRSLKCKHMVQGPSGGAAFPAGDIDPNPAVTVAEIRFNTPFQAANLRYHAAPRPTHHSHPFFPTSSSIPDPPTSDSSKRGSLSQFLNPNTYARPRAHSGPNSSSTTQSSDPARPPFNPAALLRRTSLRAGRFAHQQTNRFGHQPFHRRTRSGSTSSGGPDSDDERLDFSLARELAGGGMRGKSAKLGKLIIEDEGIKMLDLVVAACMAVWWRGYYH